MNPITMTLAGVDVPVRNGHVEIRADFARELEARLSQLVGSKDTAAYKALEGEQGKLSLDNLPDHAIVELNKLAGACEGMEAIFVQGLLTQMRKSSFAEKMDGMGNMARDLMDQNLAAQVSQSQPGFGVAKNVFANAAPRIVQEALAKMTAPAVSDK
jgi:hypothetical protein